MMDLRNYDVIYADAEEKFVKGIVLYGKTSDAYVYAKSGTTEDDKIDKDSLMEILKKGAVVSYDGAFYTPAFFKENSGHVELTFATALSAAGTTAVVLNSKEYTAG